ncbi:scarecrow-like protein 8 [Vicia villosa]|uniref:scarecrow-like protein 8 n=1 Tax=Vicia villosa TaxID=3911 RepID=UPI00273B3EB5|nr:scarecrow-like protein 8 [Vicia villosa]
MSLPGFPGGMGPSDFHGRANNFSGRYSTLPSNMNNYNNNFSNPTTTTSTTQNYHNPFYRTQQQQQQQLPSNFIDPSQIAQNRSSNLIRRYLDPATQIGYNQNSTLKRTRTLAEYQTQFINNNNNLNNNNNNLNNNNTLNNNVSDTPPTHNSANLYLSNLVLHSGRARNFLQRGSPMSPLSPMDYSNSSTESSSSAIATLLRSNPSAQNPSPMNYSNSIPQNSNFQYQYSNFAENQTTLPDPDKKMLDEQLMEIEKQLLEDIDKEQDPNCMIANSEWYETIQNLINSEQNPIQIPVSSPCSSNNSSSPSAVLPAAFSSKQWLMEAANAISEGKIDTASEILNRLALTLNPAANSDGRLTYCIISALNSRVNHFENPPPVAELFSNEHAEATQLLFDNSFCFKLAIMTGNVAIIEAAFDETTAENSYHNMMNLCVVDFDIGLGKRYKSLLYELHARLNGSPATLKITAVVDNIHDERLKMVEERLSLQAELLSIGFEFNVVTLNITELSRESLGVNPEDILAVNFAFKLFRVADESVSTENPRDELLRRVKSLSPRVVTLLEQEMNANTAPFVARVAESFSYYNALFDSIESTVGKESLERVKIEEGLSRKLGNMIACEGRDRVERCEMFGKWRARMSMAGFGLNPVSQKVAETIKARLAPGCRVTMKEENGGVFFGWMGRTLTVASAWL